MFDRDLNPPLSGTLITTLDEVSYYKFPELKQLENATEDELKELGFGYRARYIVASVKQVRRKQTFDCFIFLIRKY